MPLFEMFFDFWKRYPNIKYQLCAYSCYLLIIKPPIVTDLIYAIDLDQYNLNATI